MASEPGFSRETNAAHPSTAGRRTCKAAMLRTALLNIYQKRVQALTSRLPLAQLLARAADNPAVLNRLGLFQSAAAARARGVEQGLCRARAALECSHAADRPDPARLRGRVSDQARRQYALTLARQDPESARQWLAPADWELDLALDLAGGRADLALHKARKFASNISKSKNLHEILAAAHIQLGDFPAARNNLSQLLTDSRISVPPGDTPLRPADFIGLAPISPRAVPAGAPLISVIICARDAAPYINNALRSVWSQTYPNIEIIAIDDGSIDNTFQHLSAAASENPRINIARTKNHGVYAARNMALQRAKGDFITFLDADDIMLATRLQDQAALLQASGACATVSRLLRITADGQLAAPRVFPFVRHNPCSLMIRRDALAVIGQFEEMRFGADEEYEHRMQVLLGSHSIARSRAVQTVALHRPQSLTQHGATGLASDQGRQRRIAYRETWMRRHAGLTRLRTP